MDAERAAQLLRHARTLANHFNRPVFIVRLTEETWAVLTTCNIACDYAVIVITPEGW